MNGIRLRLPACFREVSLGELAAWMQSLRIALIELLL